MGATPFSRMFSGVSIEHGEEALTANGVIIHNVRMGIFHGPSTALVFGHTNLVSI
jgi:hypothetical protein